MQLTDVLIYEGTIRIVSGLHIGAGEGEIRIGGTDKPVIRDSLSNTPIIPGSSLKGKMRSLLEWWTGAINAKGSPATLETAKGAKKSNEALTMLKVFGTAGSESTEELKGPTRISFSDCHLNAKWLEGIKAKNLLPTEVKMENMIDRVKGTAQHPRNIERVVRGAEFDFKMTCRILNENEGGEIRSLLLQGLSLLQADTLGGSGSRGYGRIQFENLKLNGQPVQLKENPFA
jgi:CRISPR-associated protein Csm3